jgi:hypothetical protein
LLHVAHWRQPNNCHREELSAGAARSRTNAAATTKDKDATGTSDCALRVSQKPLQGAQGAKELNEVACRHRVDASLAPLQAS